MSNNEETPLREGWNRAKPDVIPRGTHWPAAMALSVMFFAWGLVSSFVIIAIGFVLFAVSLAGWIGEMRHER